MSKSIKMRPNESANGDVGQGLLTGGNSYTVSDALAAELVNRGKATYTTPIPPTTPVAAVLTSQQVAAGSAFVVGEDASGNLTNPDGTPLTVVGGGISRVDAATDYNADVVAPIAAAAAAAAAASSAAAAAAIAAAAAQTKANNAIPIPTQWAASSSGGTPHVSDASAVVGASYQNTTPGTTTFSPTIGGVASLDFNDCILCSTAGIFTVIPADNLTPAQIAAGATAGVIAVDSTGVAYKPDGSVLTVGASGPATTAWTTIWDTASVSGKDFGAFTITAALALTSSDGVSVVDGFCMATIIADGSHIPTFDGSTISNWNNTAGAHNRVELRRIGGSKYWTVGVNVGAAVVAPATAVITSAPVIAAAVAGAAVTWTPGTVTGTPTPTVTFSLKKNGTVVSSPATSGSYNNTVTGDVLLLTQAADNAAYGGGTATPVDSAPVTVSSAPTGVAVTYTQLDANRIIQRTSKTGGGQGKGQASVPVTLSFTGTQPIYARRRSAGDGTTILQSPWIANASATSGTVTLSGIDVPALNSSASAPSVANDGWFYLDLATASGGPWTNGTSAVTCGRLWAIAGQSLAVRMLGHQDAASGTNSSLSVTISPYTMMLATYNDSRAYMPTVSTMPWAPPADGGNYDSTFTSEFLRRQAQLFGCPVGAIGHAQGGTAITTFFSGGANDTQFAAVTARAGGAWEAQIWYQGHAEAAYGLPDVPYGAALTTVFTRFTALNSFSGYTKYLGAIPNIGSTTSWGTPFQRRRIRKAHADWAAANGATHVPISDLTQVDTIHENQVGAITMAQHFARASKTELGSRGDVGPALVSAVRSGVNITLTLSDVGQSTLVLSGTPGNRIHVFATGRYDSATSVSNNRFPVSSVSVTNKTTLSIVLANDPGDGHPLDMHFYWPNEAGITPANDMIRDDIVDGDGITVGRQVVPNMTAIQIAAPVPASTVNAPPSGFIAAGANSPFNMTATSGTFSAQEQTGFGQTMSGGTAIAGSNKTPSFVNYTAECWFTCPTIPGSTQVLVGGIGGDFIGITSAGKITVNGGTGATTLVAGKRYHVALQRGSAGTQVFLTNITDGTAGTRDVNNATAVTTTFGSSNLALRNHGGSFALSGGTVEEFSLWQTTRYTPTNTSYVAPTAPPVGNEAGIVALYHCDGDVTETACW